MAEACAITGGAGDKRGFDEATSGRIQGDLQDIESDLPEDVQKAGVASFRACVDKGLPIGQCVEKVQKDLQVVVDEAYKGKRLKGFIKLDYDVNVIEIKVNKFAGGNAQFGAGVATKKSYCPDPFMGKLADPGRK